MHTHNNILKKNKKITEDQKLGYIKPNLVSPYKCVDQPK